MKKVILTSVVVFCSTFLLNAQQFVGITPDFGQSGQTISTVVTSSDFYFTMGSAPTPWGDFYMNHGNTVIYPSSVNVIDDNNLAVVWPIPGGVPSGNYAVIWNYFWFTQFDVPGGFNIDCIAPPAEISPSPMYSCIGDSILLQANTGVGLSYQWYYSGNLINGATSANYYASLSGYYKVKVSNAQGCARYSYEIYKGFVSLPNSVINPSTNQIICPGNSVYLQSNYSSNYYQWFRNNVAINGATSPNYFASDTGSYTLRLTNTTGCSKMSNPVQVSFGGPPATATAQGPTTFCSGGSVNLIANAGTGYTYQWYKYGNPIAGATSQTFIATTSGIYKVQVSIGTSTCATKSAPVTVSVVAPPAATLTLQGPSSICPGDSTMLQANTGTGYTYQWYKYSNIIIGATSSSYFAKQTGTYKVRVFNSAGCSKKSPGQHIQLLSAPAANITPSGPTAICAGDFVTLQANTGSNLSYYWKKYSTVIPGATSSAYIAGTAGNYKVVVTSSNGCSKTSSSVMVSIVCRETYLNEKSDVEIFPNPAKDILHVTGSGISKIEMINAEGKIVRIIMLTVSEEIDISHFAPGLYMLIVHTQNGIVSRRIMKQ